MRSLLTAILDLTEDRTNKLLPDLAGANRVNAVGARLENYIKDLFSGNLSKNEKERIESYSNVFSFLGSQNHPPDLMIRDGDAVEIKKLQSKNSGIALNSSYPKNKLRSDSSMITQSCKNAESWKEKDLLYAIGVVEKRALSELWFVYGDCYAADETTYSSLRKKVSNSLRSGKSLKLSSTNEIARINGVDPLGITYFRLRGMWHIENPSKVFSYLFVRDRKHKFAMRAIMTNEKFSSFPNKQQKEILSCKKLKVENVKIKDPNNPARLLDSKLITYVR